MSDFDPMDFARKARANPLGQEARILAKTAQEAADEQHRRFRALLQEMIRLAQGEVPGQLFRDVALFSEKFGLAPTDDPGHRLPEELQMFRIRCIKEEVDEYCYAVGYGIGNIQGIFDEPRPREFNAEGVLDALVDLIYFALGTAYLHGFARFNEAWARVQEANMQKVRAERPEDSRRGSTFDVVKPPGWEPPKLGDLL